MNVKIEIENYSSENDKPVLLWLFSKYHFQSQWSFVAECSFEKDSKCRYGSHRVWQPTEEGIILYTHFINSTEQKNIDQSKQIFEVDHAA